MPGRRLIDENTLLSSGYSSPGQIQRRVVLRETLRALEGDGAERYHRQAAANLARWRAAVTPVEREGVEVRVIAADWGVATAALTREVGRCVAVLNMANAYLPGGAYIEGTTAQEENMFRRTDCHFRIADDEIDLERDRYVPRMTRLLTARDGVVYLDTTHPRVCVRGPADRSRDDLGYRWLNDDEVFPFFELRAAAQNLKYEAFDEDEARARIAAQLDTLIKADLRHAVLSAFGCGAFRNPASVVARLYREELERRRHDLSVIVFAIFYPGYGRDNYAPFKRVFEG